jgi:hypothetical protein
MIDLYYGPHGTSSIDTACRSAVIDDADTSLRVPYHMYTKNGLAVLRVSWPVRHHVQCPRKQTISGKVSQLWTSLLQS